jgi:hypothetical protein
VQKHKSPQRYSNPKRKGQFEDDWDFVSANDSLKGTKREIMSEIESSPDQRRKKGNLDLIDYEDE